MEPFRAIKANGSKGVRPIKELKGLAGTDPNSEKSGFMHTPEPTVECTHTVFPGTGGQLV